MKKIPLLTIIAVCGVSYHFISKMGKKEERYPIEFEYNAIYRCAAVIYPKARRHSMSACTCALKKTMQNLSYEEIKKDKTKIRIPFKSNLSECLKSK